ncbi:uncharacterized protein LOC123317673 [Coccinella septempunctata]|uniref:uncharacterized protein LOC123317673 n=1 Tax=Coccinella septempunctata TaxID=41139 RepID=UPI001D06BF79|nr:uncharacterized protein LOC123317673 [Coccinella septempunctata]
MGSPLSSFLADRFLEKLEAYIMIRWRIIVRWYRYVDDIFVILDGIPDDAHALLYFINTLHPRIKFTLELEVNRSINFLDLTISRSEDSSLTFEIYRKKTQTDHIIPAQSCHPRSHKMAALRCYVHRALNFPLSQANREKELNIIKQIALNNGYDPEVVDMIKNNVINKQRRALAYSSDVMDNLKYYSLPYMGHLSEAISHVLERSVDGYRISYSGVRSLGSLLVNSKDNVKKLDRSGVYKLKCGDCDTSYVGQTRRRLSTRIKEHLSRPQLSTFGHHLAFYRHQFSPNRNSEVLHNITGNKYNIKMNLFEDLEISREMRSNNKCVNTQVNLNNTFTPLFKRLLP